MCDEPRAHDRGDGCPSVLVDGPLAAGNGNRLASHGEHEQVWTAPEEALALDALMEMARGEACPPQSCGSPVFGRFSATEGKGLAEPAATSSGEDARGLHVR